MDLAGLATVISAEPCLQSIPFHRLLLFISSAAVLKNDILLAQPSNHPISSCPEILPPSVQLFLSRTCDLPLATVHTCWLIFKDMIWYDNDVASLLPCSPSVFNDHGLPHGFTARTLYPPDQSCTVPGCARSLKGMRMMHAEQRQCVLYTISDGPLAVYSVHLSCEACEVNYHHNYRVQKGMRVYYGGVPDLLQISEHQFVERQVVEMWMALMDNATSATACAQFYNTAMSKSTQPPTNWSFGFIVSSDHVWSAFILYCLLEDAMEREEYLIIKHTGDHTDRHNDLMRARNQRMRINGQPELTHFCDKCTRWFKDPDGEVNRKCSVVVTDGICIGRPCCGTFNCQVPLNSSKDRFCPLHADNEQICAIVGCNAPVADKQLTCSNLQHQAIEDLHRARGQSRFQLRDRLLRAHETYSPGSSRPAQTLSQLINVENDAEAFTVDPTTRMVSYSGHDDDAERIASPTSSVPTKKVRAKFTRSRTHNEQLAVAPCGIIFGQDTMFGAEGVASVAEFLKRTFRIEAIKPDHIFFDNNCSLAQHVKSDPYFSNIGLTVDVFHFKSKHKETHTFCQANCNPAAFPELISEDGNGWFFNSSVAEQTNVWIGGYLAICREMLVDKYDFFLDQMILRRNRATKAKLDKQGFHPSNWPV